MKETGFLGGSFDPVHFGHINIAVEMKEKLNLEKILFCPTGISPFKEKKPPVANNKDRYEMLKIALKDLKDFEIIDFEIKKQGVSYTVDTLNSLKGKYNLRLILTEETLEFFHLWKEYKEILEIAPPIVGVRKKQISEFKSKNFTLNSKNFVKTSVFEISSTEIRERLKKRMYVGHLVPKEVLDYIYKYNLYL